MQSLLSVLVIIGALFVFAGNGADGTARKVYYAIAASLWILTAVLAYFFYFKPTLPDTRLALMMEQYKDLWISGHATPGQCT